MDDENIDGLTREQLREKIIQLQSRLKELGAMPAVQKQDTLCQQVKECSLESLPIAVAFIGMEGTLTYVNRTFLNLFGCWSASEVLGRHINELTKNANDFVGIVKPLQHLGFWTGEVSMKRKDLSLLNVHVSARQVMDIDANPLGMMATFIDITERKFIIEKLVESEHKYSDLFENANDAIVILDVDLNITDANRKTELLTGYPRDELISKSVFDFIPPGQKPKSDEEFKKLRNEGGYENFVGRIRRKDGSLVDVEVNSSAIVEDGQIVGSRDILRDITKRLKIERELRMRDHALRHSMNGVVFADAEGRLMFANNAALRMWGYEKEEEILGRHPAEFSESPEETMEILRGILEEGSGTGETVVKRKDGSLFEVLFASTLIRDEDGVVIGIMSSFLDITGRKKTERELRMKDEAIRRSMNGIAFADEGERITYVNEAFLNMWGYDDESEVLGRTPYEFAGTPEDAERVLNEIDEKGFFLGEVPAKKKDGSLFDIHFTATLLRDESGAPITLMTSFIDITTRKKAERDLQQAHELLEQRVQERTSELRELNLDLSHEIAVRMEAEKRARQSERLFRTVFQITPDAMAISNIQEGTYLNVNEAFSLVTGYERDEVVGKSALKLRLWANSLDRDIMLTKLKADGVVRDFEVQVRRKDGYLLTGLMSGKFIEIEGTPHLLTILKDITRLKKAEEIKGEFMANVSHELRTPIHGILGHAELLLVGPLSDRQREHAELSVRSTKALLAVIDEILDYSMLASGKVHLGERPFSLEGVLEDIRDLFVIPAQDKGLSFTVHVDQDVPECLIGDPVRLKQVLMGLAGNAVKFTEKGKVSIRALREPSPEGKVMLRFHVTDTGMGVPEDVKKIIFDAFSQADGSLSRRYEGLGLGLTIASELVSLMGGVIMVISEPREGSDIFFTVPFLPVSGGGEEDPLRFTQSGKAAETSMRILLVDDNPLDRKVTSRILQKAGHTVTAVKNGNEALNAWQEDDFDLILLDVLMPEMDGYEVARTIREREKDMGKRVHILALTSLTMDDGRQKCIDAGMDDYITKPVRRSDLLSFLADMD